MRALFGLPTPVLRALGGRRPEVSTALHPEAWLLARLSLVARRRPLETLPAAEARALREREAAIFALEPAVPVAADDRTLPGPSGELRARLYTPAGASMPGPLLLYYHGGGWVIGSVDTHDAACRLLSYYAGVRVLSVDYRLAPEHPFPAAVEDASSAFDHVVSHPDAFSADPAAIAVGGDSAGANLATVTSLLARDQGGVRPAFQLLLYPPCDMSRKYESYRSFAHGYLLTASMMDWFADHYVPDVARRTDPRVSPLLADDLSGLPPAYVATSAADPLRDEGEAYARRLQESGVPVALHRQPLLHGFISLTVTKSSREALLMAAGALRQGLAVSPSDPSPSRRRALAARREH